MSRRVNDSMLLSELNQKLARNIEWRRFSSDSDPRAAQTGRR